MPDLRNAIPMSVTEYKIVWKPFVIPLMHNEELSKALQSQLETLRRLD